MVPQLWNGDKYELTMMMIEERNILKTRRGRENNV
jgi:hypothetical protein